ncbi:hypothetical protein ACIOD2_22655 [Amycolatopsis sp. NPDC088138]|uniref:hypothetical protein n=1 Tax=Amycolatopsis sp. NPDC088138 TaxID=3363938 RepID=UPI0037FAEA52
MAYHGGEQDAEPAKRAVQPPIVDMRSEFETPADAAPNRDLPKNPLVVRSAQLAPLSASCGHVEELERAHKEMDRLRDQNRRLHEKYESVRAERDSAEQFIDDLRSAVIEALAKAREVSQRKLPGVDLRGMMSELPALPARTSDNPPFDKQGGQRGN